MKQNEIDFMVMYESKILPNRQSVSGELLEKAGKLIGVVVDNSCRSCTDLSSAKLLNIYGSMKPSFDKWNKDHPKGDLDVFEPILSPYFHKKYKKVVDDTDTPDTEKVYLGVTEVKEYKKLLPTDKKIQTIE
jgi:hypothetical protein